VRISAKAEYACLAVIALAERYNENRAVPIREIVDAKGIPAPFLTQILQKLKLAGLVVSVRGSSGGYRLTRRPDEISLREIIRIIDEQSTRSSRSNGATAQLLAQVWEQIRASETQVLTNTSIASLLERSHTHNWVI
jgi:Rrf2 family protein